MKYSKGLYRLHQSFVFIIFVISLDFQSEILSWLRCRTVIFVVEISLPADDLFEVIWLKNFSQLPATVHHAIRRRPDVF